MENARTLSVPCTIKYTLSNGPQGEGAWEKRSDDHTHNAPYGRGVGRGAGGVTGGGRPASAGKFAGIGESG